MAESPDGLDIARDLDAGQARSGRAAAIPARRSPDPEHVVISAPARAASAFSRADSGAWRGCWTKTFTKAPLPVVRWIVVSPEVGVRAARSSREPGANATSAFRRRRTGRASVGLAARRLHGCARRARAGWNRLGSEVAARQPISGPTMRSTSSPFAVSMMLGTAPAGAAKPAAQRRGRPRRRSIRSAGDEMARGIALRLCLSRIACVRERPRPETPRFGQIARQEVSARGATSSSMTRILGARVSLLSHGARLTANRVGERRGWLR